MLSRNGARGLVGMLAAVLPLMSLTPSARAGTLLANTTTGIVAFQTGGAGDGTNLGAFDSGSPGGTYRRMVFGADRNGDYARELFLTTENDSIYVFNGASGAYMHTLAGTAYTGLRSIAINPANNDLYVAAFGSHEFLRYGANEADKPAEGPGATFVLDPISHNIISVRVGPDGNVYGAESTEVVRFTTGGIETYRQGGFSSVVSTIVFGPDVTGDGKAEMYAVDLSLARVAIYDVLSTPNSWTLVDTVTSDLVQPISMAFEGNQMYVTDLNLGQINRYQYNGTSWIDNPSGVNPGALFAPLPDGFDLVFVPDLIPEPASAALLLVGCGALLRRRC